MRYHFEATLECGHDYWPRAEGLWRDRPVYGQLVACPYCAREKAVIKATARSK